MAVHRPFITTTVYTPFIVDKELRNYNEVDLISLENAYKTFVVDLETRLEQEQLLLREESNISSLLNASSIGISGLMTCPRFSTNVFRFCQKIEGYYDIIFYDVRNDTVIEEDYDTSLISAKYVDATRSAIDDGQLQNYLNSAHPAMEFGGVDLQVQGSLEKVAANYPVMTDDTDLFQVESFSYVVSTLEMNSDDHTAINDAFQVFISGLLAEMESPQNVTLIEESVEVNGFANCPAGIPWYQFCETASYHYSMYVTTEGSNNRMDAADSNSEVYEKLINATSSAIFDGSFASLLSQMNSGNQMEIVDPRRATQPPSKNTRVPTASPTRSTAAPSQAPTEVAEDDTLWHIIWHENRNWLWIGVGVVLGMIIGFCMACCSCTSPQRKDGKSQQNDIEKN